MYRLLDDIFGKPSKKKRKQQILDENRRKGRAGESYVRMKYEMNGYEVERTGRGHDFRVRKYNPWSCHVIESKVVEVKTGNAKLSPLQRKTKKRKSNYKVEYIDPWFY